MLDTEGAKPAEKSVSYGWVIVAGAFIMLSITLVVQISFGIFFTPLQETFGWSRAAVSWAMTLHLLVFALCLVPVGWYLDRFDPRPIYLLAAFLVGPALLLSSRISAPWQFYLLYGLPLGVGLSICGPVILGVVARWFPTRKGVALGIASTGTGFGTIMGAPLASWLIETHGWRDAFTILGVAVFVVLLVSAFFMKGAPAQQGENRQSKGAKVASSLSAAPLRERTAWQAMRTRSFLLVMLMEGFAVFTTRVVTVHMAPYARDVGMSAVVAALAVGALGVASIAGRLLGGFFQDRIGPKNSLIMCLSAQAGFMVLLPFIRSDVLFFVFAAAFGFTWGGDVPQIPAITAQCFGMASISTIYALVLAWGNLAGAAGPAVAGYIFDVTGGYTPVFLAAAAGLFIAVLCISRVRPEN